MPIDTSKLWYPPADNKSQRYDGFVTMSTCEKVVLHDTETAGGWPSYSGGANAPHFTLNWVTGEIRQHIALNRSGGALVDSSVTTVRENRDNVVQIEITGYVDPKDPNKRDSPYWLGKWTSQGTQMLAALLAWLHTNHGLQLTAIDHWLPYNPWGRPSSYGTDNGIRLTGPQYDAFRGVLGHEHVPGNNHGDPGDLLPIEEIMQAARQIVGGSSGSGGTGGGAPPGEEIDMAFSDEQVDYVINTLAKLEARTPTNQPQVLARLDARVSSNMSARIDAVYESIFDGADGASVTRTVVTKLDAILAHLEGNQA